MIIEFHAIILVLKGSFLGYASAIAWVIIMILNLLFSMAGIEIEGEK